jgi:hypothetical protein
MPKKWLQQSCLECVFAAARNSLRMIFRANVNYRGDARPLAGNRLVNGRNRQNGAPPQDYLIFFP